MNETNTYGRRAPSALAIAAVALTSGCWRSVEPAELPKVGHVLSLETPDSEEIAVPADPDVRVSHHGQRTHFRAPVEVERTGDALVFRTLDSGTTTIALAQIDGAEVRGRGRPNASMRGCESDEERHRRRVTRVVLIVTPAVVLSGLLLTSLGDVSIGMSGGQF